MKRILLFLVIALILLQGCNTFRKKEDPSGNHMIREYYDNGKIRSEISAVGTLRHGVTRNYDRSGKLAGEVVYVNNMKHGWATNYYTSGKVHSKIMYQEGRKYGDEIWYYESGKVYRISPYTVNKLNGVQKGFYEDGTLKFEVHYKNGAPGTGLKEYSKSGKLITQPLMVIQEVNHLAMNNMYILRLSLSNRSSKVQFYKDELDEGQYLTRNILPMITEDGVAEYVISLPPGGMAVEKLNFIANYKTAMGNPCIMHKRYNLAVKN